MAPDRNILKIQLKFLPANISALSEIIHIRRTNREIDARNKLVNKESRERKKNDNNYQAIQV